MSTAQSLTAFVCFSARTKSRAFWTQGSAFLKLSCRRFTSVRQGEARQRISGNGYSSTITSLKKWRVGKKTQQETCSKRLRIGSLRSSHSWIFRATFRTGFWNNRMKRMQKRTIRTMTAMQKPKGTKTLRMFATKLKCCIRASKRRRKRRQSVSRVIWSERGINPSNWALSSKRTWRRLRHKYCST